MTYRPSRQLERIVETLIPPAYREQALGDLAECSRSQREYLGNLASIFPGMLRSQIVRRVHPWGFVFNTMVSAVSFVVTQGYPRASFFGQPGAWLRLAVPWIVWIAGLVLADAYGPVDKPAPRANTRLFLATFAATLGAAAVAGVPVPGVLIALAIVIVLSVLVFVPWLMKHQPMFPPLSLETLPQQVAAFQKGIWWRNLIETLAGIFVVSINLREVWNPGNRLEFASHLLLVLGACFVIGVLHVYAGARKVPEEASRAELLRFHCAELARQYRMLRAVPWWYLLPFVPGIVLGFIEKWGSRSPLSTALGAAAVALIFVWIWRLNQRGAKKLEQQLDEAVQLEGQLQ